MWKIICASVHKSEIDFPLWGRGEKKYTSNKLCEERRVVGMRQSYYLTGLPVLELLPELKNSILRSHNTQIGTNLHENFPMKQRLETVARSTKYGTS